MEVRNLRLIKNKDGHGTVNYKICLPTKWVNFLELYKENEVVVYLENNKRVKEILKWTRLLRN